MESKVYAILSEDCFTTSIRGGYCKVRVGWRKGLRRALLREVEASLLMDISSFLKPLQTICQLNLISSSHLTSVSY